MCNYIHMTVLDQGNRLVKISVNPVNITYETFETSWRIGGTFYYKEITQRLLTIIWDCFKSIWNV